MQYVRAGAPESSQLRGHVYREASKTVLAAKQTEVGIQHSLLRGSVLSCFAGVASLL